MTENSPGLIRLEGARRALAEARTLDEIMDVRDKAEAIRLYIRAAGLGIEMQNDAAEVKLRAERRAGELLREMPKNKGSQGTGSNQYEVRLRPATAPTLRDFGIEKTQAYRCQQVASVPAPVFEAHVATVKSEGKELTTTGVLEMVREQAAVERAQVRQEREQARPSPSWIPARIEVADATELPLDSNTVELIVTSPPYGLDKPYLGSADPAEGWGLFMLDWLGEAYRVATDCGRLAVNVPLDMSVPEPRATYAATIAAALTAGWQYRWSIVWNEGNITRTVARGSVDSPSAPHVIARVEMIAVFFRREASKTD